MNQISMPLDSTPAHARAVEYFQNGYFGKAADEFRRAVECAPGSPDLRYNLGTALAASGDHLGAVAELQIGLAMRPQDAAMLNNLGNSLGALGRHAEAENVFARALKYDRRNATILANRAQNLGLMACALREQGDEAAALPLLQRSVELQPTWAEGWNNLGTVLHDLRRLEEGEQALQRALELRPDYPLALGNLANLLLDRGEFAPAQVLYERAFELAPDSAIAHWNLSLALLANGDLARGFREFEWRFSLEHARSLYPERNAPHWQGEGVAGKRLLIYAEQGLGDSLQFVRYAPLAAALGAEVWIECPLALKTLFSHLPGIAGVLAPDERGATPDFVCPMMSLPFCFGTTLATIPAEIPYLEVAVERIIEWGRRFASRRRAPKVGLVWAGEPRRGQADAHRIDRRRSLPLEALSSLLELSGIDFFSLQKGGAAEQLTASPWSGIVTDWSADFVDFQETGALIEHLDLVIGVDTSVVHLAGALGKPTWILSRFDGCWRWLRGRSDSPWYPTVRLFRQQQPLEWATVIESVCAELVRWRDAFAANEQHG